MLQETFIHIDNMPKLHLALILGALCLVCMAWSWWVDHRRPDLADLIVAREERAAEAEEVNLAP